MAHRARCGDFERRCARTRAGLLGRLEQLVAQAIGSAPDKHLAINANRLARVIVTFTRGLAVMERAGYSRKQLRESAATFVDAMVGGA